MDVQNLKDILKWLFEKTFYSFDIVRLYEIIDNLDEKAKEYEANKNLTNSRLEDRQRRRVADSGGRAPDVASYMAKYGVK